MPPVAPFLRLLDALFTGPATQNRARAGIDLFTGARGGPRPMLDPAITSVSGEFIPQAGGRTPFIDPNFGAPRTNMLGSISPAGPASAGQTARPPTQTASPGAMKLGETKSLPRGFKVQWELSDRFEDTFIVTHPNGGRWRFDIQPRQGAAEVNIAYARPDRNAFLFLTDPPRPGEGIGIGVLRALMREIGKIHPSIRSFGGHRVSGAHQRNIGANQEQVIPRGRF